MVCPSLSLATLSLVALAAASPISTKPRQPGHGKTPAILPKRSHPEVRTNNGKSMDSKMIPGVGNNWQCFDPVGTTPRPNPLDCQALFAEWNAMGRLTLEKTGGCDFKHHRSCFTYVCALKDTVEVDASLLAARMMNPMQTTCVVNGKNGIWTNDEETLSIVFDEDPDVEIPEDAFENGDSDDGDSDDGDSDDGDSDDGDSDDGDSDDTDENNESDDNDPDDNNDSDDTDENNESDGNDPDDNEGDADEDSGDENPDDDNTNNEDPTDEDGDDGGDDAGSDDEISWRRRF
ncbi:uncharacterized protein LY79DRAFT_665075 [Colletotrichum navitas]|uniref:Uncharacterized protein n=1 Tax=Colletotrichum navitas TaxID=681940 RepID=A0AAD8QCC8_9PEZI|nr:uncharacterized protein LY79DRAFT_665075 [Colletotrichum navitas]KAK1599381.1 hypothetical protein LY79DRAFT_665075 [Colletotrichum navitas]